MTDMLWLSDLDPNGTETQSDSDEVVQDALHVIEQDLGSNLDDLTRGLGVANSLSKPLPSGLTVAASNEIAKDDRVTRCDAELIADAQGNYSLNLTIYTNEDILSLPVPVGTVNPSVAGH